MMPDVDRRPTAITLKSLLGILWAPTAFGLVRLPGSLRDGPDIFGQVAAVVCVLGCLISVIGLVWGMRRDQSAGLLIEQLGLVGMGCGCAMYAFALLGVETFSDAALAFGLCVCLAGFAFTQHWLISRHRKRIKAANLAAAKALAGAGDGQ